MRLARVALLAAVPLSLALPARAEGCPDLPVSVELRCTAELLGQGGLTKKLEAWTKPLPLSVRSGGKSATVQLGEYRLTASLTCETGQIEKTMGYAFHLELVQKSRSTSPVRLATLRNLDLEHRVGKAPLRVESYSYFQPALTLEDLPVQFTRLDYSCSVEASAP